MSTALHAGERRSDDPPDGRLEAGADPEQCSDGSTGRSDDARAGAFDDPRDRETPAVHVRNFDVTRRATLRLDIRDGDGVTRFERTFRLSPGRFEQETFALPAGEYAVEVRTTHGTRKTAAFRVGSDASGDLVVETDGGVVSVTDRLYGSQRV